MKLGGLSYSIASISGSAAECPHCHGTSTVANGLCLVCMLESGIDQKDLGTRIEFAASLDAMKITDTHWRLGNYEILEEIGRGGMGVIYRARQRHSRRIVAVKRLLSYQADSRETLTRFRREAEAAASLDHPNILPIYDVSESEGVPFFSMKFAAGGSLQQVGPNLRDNSREIIRLMAKVTRAVQYAHREGILHRDLKPGNILLDARGEPLVADFGLAKWLETNTELTRTLTVFGTPGYIAPEQARGQPADLKPTADVYSLGAILFELLAGRPPFLGEHALAVVQHAAEKPAPNLRSLVEHADRDLETICARCLEREPTLRYHSAGDLAEDLERWLEGRPIVARPVSLPVKVWRWSKRNPLISAAAAGLFIVSCLAIARQVETYRLSEKVRQDQLARRSILIVPFLDLDTAQPDELLARSVSGWLESSLSRFGPTRIISLPHNEESWAGTASVADLRAANQKSAARAVMTGSSRIVSGNQRISLRLLNADTADVLFTKTLEILPHSDLRPAVEGAITSTIQTILDLKDWSSITSLARDPGMLNPTARDFIISGRQLMFRDTLEDYDRSIRCLERAIALEPRSAIAHAYLSSTQASRVHFAPDGHLLKRAEAEAREALRLNPDLAETHRTLAGALYQRNEFAEALEEQLRAIEVGGPEEHVTSSRAMTLIQVGQPGRALPWLDMANHWASAPGSYESLIGDCWTLLTEDDKAEAAYHRAMDLRPESPNGWIGLCHLRLLQGDAKSARRLIIDNEEQRVEDMIAVNDNHPAEIRAQVEFFSRNYPEAEQFYSRLSKSNPDGGIFSYGSLSYASCLGRARQSLGKQAEAQSILEGALARESAIPSRFNDPATCYRIAAIEASLGHVNIALRYLEAAITAGWLDYRSLQLDPRFDGISQDRRFRDFISKVKTRVIELKGQASQPMNITTTQQADLQTQTKRNN